MLVCGRPAGHHADLYNIGSRFRRAHRRHLCGARPHWRPEDLRANLADCDSASRKKKMLGIAGRRGAGDRVHRHFRACHAGSAPAPIGLHAGQQSPPRPPHEPRCGIRFRRSLAPGALIHWQRRQVCVADELHPDPLTSCLPDEPHRPPVPGSNTGCALYGRVRRTAYGTRGTRLRPLLR